MPQMTNLNAVFVEDIIAAGVEPAAASALAFWRPYRCWDDLLSVNEVDDGVVRLLRTSGFDIVPPDDSGWAAPKAFDLSNRSR